MNEITNSKHIPSWNEEAKVVSKEILNLIKSSNHILLHCHPSPDGDSLGSTLAMKMVIEGMGKKVIAIAGDSKLPDGFSHMPGFNTITIKNIFEINLSDFDLFIAQDSASLEMVSRLGPVVFPSTLKTVVIDHHRTNTCYGDINLVIPSLPANCALLTLVFRDWNAVLDPNIARCLLLGMYTDTGGFKYKGVTGEVFEQAAFLCSIDPSIPSSFSSDISSMENSNIAQEIYIAGIGLSKSSISIHEINSKKNSKVKLAISLVSKVNMENIGGIDMENTNCHTIVNLLLSVRDFDIAVSVIQKNDSLFKASFRSKSEIDVGMVAKLLGGGGHKNAAGASISIENASGMDNGEVLKLVRKNIESAVESYLCKD